MQNSVLCYLENTVQKYSDKVAVVDEKSSITFKELRNHSLIVSETIRAKVKETHIPIMVYLPKSVQSIVSFMGILYSNNFYTPTDVRFPFEKVKSIITCLNPSIIISDTKNSEILISNGIEASKIINLDTINYNKVLDKKVDKIDEIIDTDIVYTLFTSGSTGVPKGVSITNRSIIDYIDWAKECYKIDSTIKIGNQAPLYFDNSTLDVYLCISTGATLYIIPEMYFAFPAKLMDYIQKEEISLIFWVPSVMISVANNDLLSRIDCSCLKKILFAGEVMPNRHLNYWRRHIPGALYSNLYGPTEITVDCTYFIVNREFKDDEPLPIGFPCKNTGILVLSEENKLVKQKNEIGELCVRGSSLAVGYWGNKEKTDEAFVQNPLNAHYPEKIYRTGDLVYYNEFGELVFSGRKDFQIKHLGYRIELGEIETAVLSIKQIRNACVCYNNKERQIILFFESIEGFIEEKYIRKALSSIIPKYMIPTKYYKMDKIPLNDNGKMDRKLLKLKYLLN